MAADHYIETVCELIDRFGETWGFDHLSAFVHEVRFSRRLTRNYGYFRYDQRRMVLAERLLDAPEPFFLEVVAHEAAHVAEFVQREGRPVRGHSPHWRALMRQAGFSGRARLPGLPNDPPVQRQWLHQCTGCGANRRAGKPMRAWRCVACVRAGRPGHLEIQRLAS